MKISILPLLSGNHSFSKKEFKGNVFSLTHLAFNQSSCLLAVKQLIITIVFESLRPQNELLEENGLKEMARYIYTGISP